MAEKFVQIQLSEINDEHGYSVTIAALTDAGRIFMTSNALGKNDWCEIPLPENL